MTKNLVEIVLNILFWLSSTLLIVSFFSIDAVEVEVVNGQSIERFNQNDTLVKLYLIGQIFIAANFYTQLYISQQLKDTSGILKLLLKSLGAYLICALLFYLTAEKFILTEYLSFPSVAYGIILFYTVIALGYGFIKNWVRNEHHKKELELSKNRVELDLLRSQLHPHFLFNTMNNLMSMVDQKENPILANSIDRLSGLLRYVVYDTKHETVSLNKEIEFIRNFADLQLLRYEEHEVDFKINLKGPFDHQLIAPGILLCFIENAFKHGVAPEVRSFIYIDIDVSFDGTIIFKIVNSIPTRKNLVDETGGYGLNSTRERLNLIYPERHILQINEGETYSVLLSIDHGTKNDHS